MVRALTSLSALLLLSSCGYQFQGSGSILPPDVKTVAVLPVENLTTESALGLRFRDALTERFERYGVVSVVEQPSQADAILTAKIKEVDVKTRNTTGDANVAVDLQLVFTVSGELKKRDGQILWRDEDVRVAESFAGTGDVVVTSSSQFAQGNISGDTLQGLGASDISRGQKSEALEGAMEEAAQKIYNDAVAADF